ncbi:metallophosphatase family protein [Cardiobacteriaceae bacterium TAE3-ERU3]|nr:metallophosphatase family protein [Cardiobacteriaceae bacterium TAE3-ERU3]
MKLAVIADIHGNAPALEAVLADIARRGVDKIVNLGDIFYGPIAPANTLALLQESDALTISGNQDRLLLEAATGDRTRNPTIDFVLTELGDAGLDWLRQLPATAVIGDVLLCHGSPTCDETYLLEKVIDGGMVLRDDDEITASLAGYNHAVVCCGHTHLPRVVQLSNGQLVVNPGSVGMPAYADDAPQLHKMESGSPHAQYAILQQRQYGWDVEHIRLAYDWQQAAALAKVNGRADWAQLLLSGRA